MDLMGQHSIFISVFIMFGQIGKKMSNVCKSWIENDTSEVQPVRTALHWLSHSCLWLSTGGLWGVEDSLRPWWSWNFWLSTCQHVAAIDLIAFPKQLPVGDGFRALFLFSHSPSDKFLALLHTQKQLDLSLCRTKSGQDRTSVWKINCPSGGCFSLHFLKPQKCT